MTAAAVRARGRWIASPFAIAGALVVTVLVTVAVFRSADDGDSARPSLDRTAAATYAAAIERLSTDGGQIVADGIKPGAADIAQRTLPDEVLARMAQGWVASMDDVRREIAALEAPGVLASIAVRYDRALVTYVRTAETLFEAATAADARRADLVDHAIALGIDADRLWDEAAEALAELQLALTGADR